MTTRVLAALALAAASKANVQTFEDVCVPTTEEEKAVLAKEVTSYMHNWRYKLKIREVQGLAKPDPRQPAILACDPVFVLNRYGSLDVHLHVPLFIFGASG